MKVETKNYIIQFKEKTKLTSSITGLLMIAVDDVISPKVAFSKIS